MSKKNKEQSFNWPKLAYELFCEIVGPGLELEAEFKGLIRKAEKELRKAGYIARNEPSILKQVAKLEQEEEEEFEIFQKFEKGELQEVVWGVDTYQGNVVIGMNNGGEDQYFGLSPEDALKFLAMLAANISNVVSTPPEETEETEGAEVVFEDGKLLS